MLQHQADLGYTLQPQILRAPVCPSRPCIQFQLCSPCQASRMTIPSVSKIIPTALRPSQQCSPWQASCMTRASVSDPRPVSSTSPGPSLSAVMKLEKRISGEDHRTVAAARLKQPLLAETQLLYMTMDNVQDMLLPACLLPAIMQANAAANLSAVGMSRLNSSSRAEARFSMQSKVAHTAGLHILQQRQPQSTRLPVCSSEESQAIGVSHILDREKMTQPMREDLTWQTGPRTALVDLRCSRQPHRRMLVRKVVSKSFQRPREAARLLLCSSKRSWI